MATWSDEAQLKRRIVLAVQRALPARRLQQVAPHRVGLKESLKIVIKKLNLMGDSVGAQVEDMDSEPENALEGYQSEANTILQPDGTPSTCFMLVSSSWLMHEVLKMVVIQVE